MREQKYYLVFDEIERGIILRNLNELCNWLLSEGRYTDVVDGMLKGLDLEDISNRQKEIYKESGMRKRACKTEADVREFQIWHMQAQEERDNLKIEKKDIKDNLTI